MSDTIEIKCIEVHQPIGSFLIGAINSRDLFEMAFAEVRRFDGRDIEKYIGIQRDLSAGRVAEISKYVTTVDACFPTSIILAIDTLEPETKRRWASFCSETGILTLEKNSNIAKIIDGQHRIAGLENYAGEPFELNVTIFLDMDVEDQAMVFATINLKQTKVGKSLAYDLYEFAKARSPQKTCHNIARLLNYKNESPLAKRIKILGKSEHGEMEAITQATFVDRLLLHISKNPMEDKDRLKRGKKLEDLENPRFIFRKKFSEERDAEIAKILWNYFDAVSMRWPKAWNTVERGQVLSRTTGFAALMRLLPSVMKKTQADFPSTDMFLQILQKISIQEGEFTSDRFKPGSSGESEMVRVFEDGISG